MNCCMYRGVSSTVSNGKLQWPGNQKKLKTHKIETWKGIEQCKRNGNVLYPTLLLHSWSNKFSHRSLGWFGTKTHGSSRRKRSSHKTEPTNPDIQQLQQLDCHLLRYHTQCAKDVAKYRSLATLYLLILEHLKSWAFLQRFGKEISNWYLTTKSSLSKSEKMGSSNTARTLEPVGIHSLLSLQSAVQGFHLWNPQLQVLLHAMPQDQLKSSYHWV